MMISIDPQPWEHRGGLAFVTSKLNPIADPQRALMNWPCSPSLFNWWHVPFQVDHRYVSCIHWFSKRPPPSPALLFLAFLRHLSACYKPATTLIGPRRKRKAACLELASPPLVKLLERIRRLHRNWAKVKFISFTENTTDETDLTLLTYNIPQRGWGT